MKTTNFFPSKYCKAADFDDGPRKATIADVLNSPHDERR